MNRLGWIGFSILAGMVLYGCGGSKTTTVAPVTETVERKAPDALNSGEMPEFVLNAPVEKGFLFGTGIAEQASPQLAKETADLRAKREIAKALSEKVSTLMEDVLGQLGTGEEAEITEAVQSVTRSVSQIDLVGCTIVKRDYKGGRMYSLAKYPLDDSMRKLINGEVEKALTSKEAMLSAFRAKQGFDKLDAELAKLQ